MKVMLKRNLPGKGSIGDIIEVKDGYARNFLIPKDLVLPVLKTKESKKQVAKWLEGLEEYKKTIAKEHNVLIELKNIIKESNKPIKIEAKANDQGMLFSSIKSEIICEKIDKSFSFKISKDYIFIKNPIKSTGKHTIYFKIDNRLEPICLEVVKDVS